ncbi:response regulator [Muricauda sp. CAU 1633]|uniref:response regulator n=1 Tax=Allomuricauda sp. CAU 1633 TaxID=2816036 RepID=UPI001A904B77|nr:response regulator [Muricauda sp. CAU 1633]MBO0323162.1 response regulator [Muricauda sp. CAU 1633]
MERLKSILLVDDDETTNLVNSFFIRQLDSSLQVNKARNGKEAIAFLQKASPKEDLPCLLLLDVNMSIMNGWEFLDVYTEKFGDHLKEDVVIVVLTGMDLDDNAMAMTHPSVVEMVQKPLSDIKFRALVTKHFFSD